MAQKKTSKGKTTTSRKKTEARTKSRSRSTRSATTRGGTSKSKRTTTRRKTTKQSKPAFTLNIHQKALIFGIGIILITFILVLSLLSPNQGQLTTALSGLMWRLFGWGGVVMPVITAIAGLYLVLWGMEQPPNLPGYRLVGFGILFLMFEAFATMSALNSGFADVWAVAQAEAGGGYVGGIVAEILIQFVGFFGAIFILLVAGSIGAILATGISRADLGAMLARSWQGLRAGSDDESAPTTSRRKPIRLNPARSDGQEAVQLPLMPEAEAEAELTEPNEKAEKPKKRPSRSRRRKQEQPAPPQETPTIVSPVFVGNARGGKNPSWKIPTMADMLAPGSDPSVNNSMIQRQVEIIEHTLESFGAPATTVEINQGPTVTQFGIEPNYLEMRNGKRTRVKVSKIAGLSDDLALALAAESIRIEAPVPGKGYIGIEVPNPSKAIVSLRDVMESPGFRKLKSNLRIGLGHDVSGQAISADLASMPHLLVAGTTGSGKSVCVNGIIACLLLQNSPDDLKLVMVDPKRVELTGYNGIPHLAAPVVVEMDRVIGTLQWALREMDSRYKLFAQVGARNIKDYNKKIKGHADKERMPYVVIIIDELADLMMMAPEDTERAIARLAQMARATGIHMVIATQRPSVDVVTGLIKANFPARIAFAVASSTDSRVILDTTGAERLLGQGDMLFQSPDAAMPVRLQGCYVSDDELNKLIKYWQTARRFNMVNTKEQVVQRPQELAEKMANRRARKTENSPAPKRETTKKEPPQSPSAATEQDEELIIPPPQVKLPKKTRKKKETVIEQRPLWEALDELEDAPEEELADELLPEAIALVRKLNKASTSLLQRRFRIGYTRAARLIDYMEDKKIIGPPTGTSKAREVMPANHDDNEASDDPSEKTDEKRVELS
ncbi:MAG: DNA translocase FtsK 4TM domain-containing protein [Chloroflexota bacterium]